MRTKQKRTLPSKFTTFQYLLGRKRAAIITSYDYEMTCSDPSHHSNNMLRIQWKDAQRGTAIHFIPSSHDTSRESSVADGTNNLRRLHTNVETLFWTVIAGSLLPWNSSTISSTHQYNSLVTNMSQAVEVSSVIVFHSDVSRKLRKVRKFCHQDPQMKTRLLTLKTVVVNESSS